MNAELVVKAIVEIGKADEASLPQALQELADSLGYKHAAIVEADKQGTYWVPTRTVCKSKEFRRACRSVLGVLCESRDPVRSFVLTSAQDLTQSVLETDTYAAAGVHLQTMCTPMKKTLLMLVSDDRNTKISDMEKRLLSTVGTLVCRGLAGQELDIPSPGETGGETAEDRIEETIGMVSHDLRNPVGTILGYTELLLATKMGSDMPADQRVAINKIRDNSLFILHLLGDLLESAQIDSGKISIRTQPGDLATVIEESVERCRMAAEKKQIAVSVELAQPQLMVKMDKVKIGQVIDNLLTNAIKFSRAGSAVRITATPSADGFEIAVQDSGLGIPAAEVPNLFKRWSRTSTRGTAGEKSTGLGLYIVAELVRIHGGTVRVDTQVDRGSTFTFTLPSA